MLCAKHNNDITNKDNKEQFGDIWLCRNAIWDSEMVNDLMLKQEVQDAYHERKANPPDKIQASRDFYASNPTDAQIVEYWKSLKK